MHQTKPFFLYSIEDCFEDIERPKFGFMVKVMIKENEPCVLENPNPNQSICVFQSNLDSIGKENL